MRGGPRPSLQTGKKRRETFSESGGGRIKVEGGKKEKPLQIKIL